LDLQEFWDDPWLGLELVKSSFENDFIGVRWLLVFLVGVFSEHDLEEEPENLPGLLCIWKQERVEGDVGIVVQLLQIALDLLANAKFVSLNGELL